jgi:truncated hemoglobin YjbI
MADIIDDFLTRLQQHVPSVPADALPKLEQTLRQAWGGTEPYVGKRMNRVTRTTLVAAGLRQQKSLKDCFAQAGVGRTVGYQLLKRR